MALFHECENGQIVSYNTAESSYVENGHIYIVDAKVEVLGHQPFPEIVKEQKEEEHDDSKPDSASGEKAGGAGAFGPEGVQPVVPTEPGSDAGSKPSVA